MIFQSFNLVKRTTVLNNVLMGRLYKTPTWRSLLGRYRAEDVELAMRGTGARRDRRQGLRPRVAPLRRPAAAGRDRPRTGAGAEDLPRR